MTWFLGPYTANMWSPVVYAKVVQKRMDVCGLSNPKRIKVKQTTKN